MIIAVASALAALREGDARLRGTRARPTSLLIPVAAGVLGGVIGFLATGGYPETRLLDPWPSAHR